jgi:hypothetical protein
MTKRSTHDWQMAANYARLALKSASADQDAAERIIREIWTHVATTDMQGITAMLARELMIVTGERK